MSGNWIRRVPQTSHRCDAPQGSLGDPSGRRGDLWRCDCGALWRIGRACAPCEYYGYGNHRGAHLVGNAWLPATMWQRIGVRLRRWFR